MGTSNYLFANKKMLRLVVELVIPLYATAFVEYTPNIKCPGTMAMGMSYLDSLSSPDAFKKERGADNGGSQAEFEREMTRRRNAIEEKNRSASQVAANNGVSYSYGRQEQTTNEDLPRFQAGMDRKGSEAEDEKKVAMKAAAEAATRWQMELARRAKAAAENKAEVQYIGNNIAKKKSKVSKPYIKIDDLKEGTKSNNMGQELSKWVKIDSEKKIKTKTGAFLEAAGRAIKEGRYVGRDAANKTAQSAANNKLNDELKKKNDEDIRKQAELFKNTRMDAEKKLKAETDGFLEAAKNALDEAAGKVNAEASVLWQDFYSKVKEEANAKWQESSAKIVAKINGGKWQEEPPKSEKIKAENLKKQVTGTEKFGVIQQKESTNISETSTGKKAKVKVGFVLANEGEEIAEKVNEEDISREKFQNGVYSVDKLTRTNTMTTKKAGENPANGDIVDKNVDAGTEKRGEVEKREISEAQVASVVKNVEATRGTPIKTKEGKKRVGSNDWRYGSSIKVKVNAENKEKTTESTTTTEKGSVSEMVELDVKNKQEIKDGKEVKNVVVADNTMGVKNIDHQDGSATGTRLEAAINAGEKMNLAGQETYEKNRNRVIESMNEKIGNDLAEDSKMNRKQEVVNPIETMLDQRSKFRSRGEWEAADKIKHQLVEESYPREMLNEPKFNNISNDSDLLSSTDIRITSGAINEPQYNKISNADDVIPTSRKVPAPRVPINESKYINVTNTDSTLSSFPDIPATSVTSPPLSQSSTSASRIPYKASQYRQTKATIDASSHFENAIEKCNRFIERTSTSDDLNEIQRAYTAQRVKSVLENVYVSMPKLSELNNEYDDLYLNGLQAQLQASSADAFLKKWEEAQTHLVGVINCLEDGY